MTGWVKLHRQIKNKAFYSKDSEKVHLWIHILMNANHAGREEIFAGKPIKCNPGQFTTGRKQLSEQTGISESKIQRILTYFEKIEQQIEQQTSSTSRLISVVNWNKYQASEQQTEQQVNSDRTASEQQVNSDRTHFKNVNNVKNDNNESKKLFQSCYSEFRAKQTWLEDLAMKRSYSIFEINTLSSKFLEELTEKNGGDEDCRPLDELTKYFVNWLKHNKPERLKTQEDAKSNTRGGGIDPEKGKRSMQFRSRQ